MVTLRRDISESESNYISAPHGEMTDYDRFMLGKRSSEAVIECSGSRNYAYGTSESKNSDAEYRDYMLRQLNRDHPETMVTKEQFYMDRFVSGHASAPARKPFRKMTKAGKIFTAVYVLIFVALASIIIAVNAGGAKEPVAEAVATGGEIEALQIEQNAVEGSAYDDFLDALTNK